MPILLPPEQHTISYDDEVGTKIKGPFGIGDGKVETAQLLTRDTRGEAAKIRPACQRGGVVETRLSFEGSHYVLFGAARVGADLKGKGLGSSPDAYVFRLSSRFTWEAGKHNSKGRRTGPESLTVPCTLVEVIDLQQFKLIVKMEDGSIVWQCKLPPGHDYQPVVATRSSSCRVKLLTATMGGAGAQ